MNLGRSLLRLDSFFALDQTQAGIRLLGHGLFGFVLCLRFGFRVLAFVLCLGFVLRLRFGFRLFGFRLLRLFGYDVHVETDGLSAVECADAFAPSAALIDLSLPRLKDLAVGIPGAQEWVHDLPNDANKKFVANYKARFKSSPSFYGAQTYDAVSLIDSGLRAVKGDMSKKDELQRALEKADFKSVRGNFKFGHNHIPIQNFYLQDAVKQGDDYVLKTVATIVENDQDMPRLAERVGAVLDQQPGAHAFLLRRHGLYTWGSTLADAERHIEILEFLFAAVGRTLQLQRVVD